MKTLSIVPAIALGSIVTFLAVFSPINMVMNPSAAVEMTVTEKKKKFKEFIDNFENVELPYSVDQTNFIGYMTDRKSGSSLYNSNHRIGSEFKAFVPGLSSRFSRMGPNIYLYEAVIASSEEAATVIYSSHAPYRDYPEYLLVTYNGLGVITSKTIFAHRSYDHLVIGEVDKSKHVTIKKYTFDYEDEDIRYEEKIDEAKLNLKSVATSKISKNGTIEQTTTAAIQEEKIEETTGARTK